MKIIKRENEEEKCGSISLTHNSVTMWMGLDDMMNYMNSIFPIRLACATTYTAASYSSMITTTKKKNKDKIPFYDTLNGGNKYFKQKYKK